MLSTNDYKSEDLRIKGIFDTINTTILFVSQAYSHFYAYSFGEFSQEDSRRLKNEIFTFQTMTAQFFLVVQFCKLLENQVNGDEGESSLYKLNNLLRKKYPTDFSWHSQNVQTLKEIRKTKIFVLLTDLRNKSYGHSDNHPLNTPLKFIFFNEAQSIEFKGIFLKAIDVFKNCYRLYDIGTGFHHFYDSNSALNFLKGYLRGKEALQRKIRK
ncbi:MAG TPA: hypothetical protein VGQ53_19225 [Chitinophagaceae bacterium]|nr:hypothetical protein [Chitinophagaceae bacterium]